MTLSTGNGSYAMRLSISPGLASRRQRRQGAHSPSDAVSDVAVVSRAGRGAGRGMYFNWTGARFARSSVDISVESVSLWQGEEMTA